MPGVHTARRQDRPVRRDPEKVARWLWQLLGFAWLDHARGDRHHITHVGLYFARHGHLTTWTVDDLAVQLLDGADPAPARPAFLELADAAWRRESGRTTHFPI